MPALGGLPPTRVEGRPLNGEVNPGLAGSWRELGDCKGPVVYPWQHLSLCSLSGRVSVRLPALGQLCRCRARGMRTCVPGGHQATPSPRCSSSHPPPPTCQQMLLAFPCTRVQRPPCPTATTAHACLAPRGSLSFHLPRGALLRPKSHQVTHPLLGLKWLRTLLPLEALGVRLCRPGW